jgi:predicted O-methyltransferase YrrM
VKGDAMNAAPSLRGRWRRLALGLPTVLGLRPRGWFIPHRYAPLLPPPGAQPPYPAIEQLFERSSPDFSAVLDAVDRHATALEGLKTLFNQSWFPSLDAAVAYTLVRERKPQRIVEVGSGHSTRVLSRALGGVGEIVAVDPSPRADIIDLPGVRVVPSTLQAASVDLFDALKAGDALFVDSSHILMPGSDVDILLNRVLPMLPAGALVHIHDIFLPYDYPPIWGWRAYNEQQGVMPLLATGAYRPLFSSVWVERRLTARLQASVVPRLPQPPDAIAASLWLEKC